MGSLDRRQGQQTEDRRAGGHEDGPEPPAPADADGLVHGEAVAPQVVDVVPALAAQPDDADADALVRTDDTTRPGRAGPTRDRTAAGGERARLNERLTQISALINRELKRARIAGQGPGKHFRPSRHVPELVQAITQMHQQRGISIDVGSLPDQLLPLDYEDMLELCGNLVDNACKWASARVAISVALDAGQLLIRVADDGPGVAPAEREALLERGTRLDEQRPGHGLGLAIVHDLVSDYRGTLVLGRSAELGGLEVEVRLPLAANSSPS